MEFEYLESQKANHTTFMYDTIYFQSPGENGEFKEGDWGDEEDEDFDDKAEDVDDLHSVQVNDDLNEPDAEPDDDDHLPDDDLQ
ncbi:hypothetical protein [Mucilaginibacter sp.]|uniref:hypothetical protein n=1 Tax=Mucilaginibacter sp. TaxID=1882438 RepID=UPI00260EF616|nr:hypothetical protein [Mucilaginibacter sp.]